MKLILVNIYPDSTVAKYSLSSYVLKAYISKYWSIKTELFISVLNYHVNTESDLIVKDILRYNPDVVGFSCYVWNMSKIIEVGKSIKRVFSGVVVLGGPEVSFDAALRTADKGVSDYFIVGEGEKRLLRLLALIESGEIPSKNKIPSGIVYWEQGELKYVQDDNIVKDLNEIPSVYIDDILEHSLYERQQAFLETQRGCDFKCGYCVYHRNRKGVCYYSVKRIYAELDYLIMDRQIMALRIFDANFTSDLNRAKEIIRHLLEIKKGGKSRLPWIYWELCYQNLDLEFMELLSSLKYREEILNSDEIPPLDRPQLYSEMLKDYTVVNSIGIQSFSRDALTAVARPAIDLDRFRGFMDSARGYNIALKLDIILGLPRETFESYFNGLEIILPYFKNTDHVLNIHVLQILPGSNLEKYSSRYGVKFLDSNPHYVISTDTFTSDEIIRAKRLSGILFRVINSPLRRMFFESWEKSGKNITMFLEDLFCEIETAIDIDAVKLLNDEYWNNEIFKGLPSDRLMVCLDNGPKNK